MADYLTTDTELTSVANAIRTKGGTSSALVYPTGFVSAIQNLPSGGGTDVSDTTAVAGDVLSGKYFHIADGTKVQGTIASKTSSDVTTSNNVVTIPAGHYASQVQKTVGTAQAAQTITPTTSDQTIASGKYLTGTQTIKGDANLVAGNIKNGTTIFGVMGTYSGGGGGGNIKRIAGNGMNSAVNVSGWSTDDFLLNANVIDANDPKFLIAHVTVSNNVRSFACAKIESDTTLIFTGSKSGVDWDFSIEFTITKTNKNINTISLTNKSSPQVTIGTWEIISNLPTYTPTQVVSFTLILKDYDGYGTDYEVDVSNYGATTWNDLVDDTGFEAEYQISIVEDSENSAAVFDPAGIGANMLIHNSDDPNDDYTLVTDAIIDGHTYYAYYG